MCALSLFDKIFGLLKRLQQTLHLGKYYNYVLTEDKYSFEK